MVENATPMRIAGGHKNALPKRFNFTIRSLEALKVPAGKDRVWVYDTGAPRLAYMLTAAGARSFYYVYKDRGNKVRDRIGGAEIGIENARNAAKRRANKLVEGVDLRAEKHAIRAESTIGDLWTRYLETYAKLKKRSWEKDVERYEKHVAGWANRRLTSITRDDVAALHARIGKTHPGAANRTLSLISAMFSKTKQQTNPARGVDRFPEKKRDRALLDDERQRFLAALAKTPQPWRDLFQVALLTGQRIGNIRSMRWDELSLADAVWRIPAEKFKTKEPHSVALDPIIVKLLRARAGNNSEWVFPADSACGYIAEPKTAWADLCKRAKLSGVWIHDLRATNATMQAGLGVSAMLIQRALGHRSMQTTQRYVRLAMDPLRASATITAAAMMKKPKNVKASRKKPAKVK